MKKGKWFLHVLLLLVVPLILAAPALAVIYVDTSTGNDANNGSDWGAGNAKKTIQAGVTAANGAGQDKIVWVAKGTYLEPGNMILPVGIKVSGSFAAGVHPTDPNPYGSRDFVANNSTVHPGVAANSTFTANGTSASPNVIDGFTIEFGQAQQGGAIKLAANASCLVANCVIRFNVSPSPIAGGGIYASATPGAGAFLNITNTQFANNTSNLGGAIYSNGTGVSVTGCSFIGDSAKDYTNPSNALGGAIYVTDASLSVSKSTFTQESAQITQTNTGSAKGGAIAVIAATTLSIDANTFKDCKAAGGTVATYFGWGGAIYIESTSCNITNNWIIRCSALGTGSVRPAFGGGIAYVDPGIPNIFNNTFFSDQVTPNPGMVSDPDRPYGLGASIYLLGSDQASIINNIIDKSRGTAVVNEGMIVTFNYNLLWHNAGGDTFGITFPINDPTHNKIDGNIMRDPQFLDWKHDNLHITYGSPAKDHGI